MGLAQPRAAVYEQGVVLLARALRHRQRRRVRQAVGGAHYEVLEGVAGVEGVAAAFFKYRHGFGGGGDDHLVELHAEIRRGGVKQRVFVYLVHVLGGELVGMREQKQALLRGIHREILEPVIFGFAHLFPEGFLHAFPAVLCPVYVHFVPNAPFARVSCGLYGLL